jgi:hypothetical protein
MLLEKIERMKKHFSVFLVFISFILGCASTGTVESTKIAPSEIYQEYSISARRNQTNVSAIFREDGALGTTVDLDAPSKIEHNGKEMRENPPSFLKGTTYYDEVSRFEPAHKFVYTDSAGKIYQNEIRLEPLEISGDSFNLSGAGTNRIPVSRPVGASETIIVSLTSETAPPPKETNTNANTNPDDAPTYSFTVPANLDETRAAFIIEPSLLKKFAPGKAHLSFEVRKEVTATQMTNKGGKMTFSYESASVAVNVLN